MKFAKSVFVVLGFALLSPAPFTHLIPAAHAQDQVWIRQFGTRTYDYAYALAPDGAGGVMVAGSTWGSLGGPNAGDYDAYLARYDIAGNRLWIRQFGTSRSDGASALAPDGAGGAMIAGRTVGSLGGTSAGGSDIFLARYDSAGNRLWIRQFGTSDWVEALALASDDSGGVTVAGWTSGSLGGPTAGGRDALLARYDGAGNQLWIRQFGTSENEKADALAPDGAGGAIVAGFTDGSLGGPSAGLSDVFLARYDGAGNRLWITQFGTSEWEVARALAPDGAGGVMVAGWTTGSLGGPQAGHGDPFLARFGRAGNQLWIRQFGTSAWEEASWALALDGAGGVMVAGHTAGSLGGPNAGGEDAFLARYEIDSCYPDCDGSGTLDIFDFLCFQNSFVLGEPYACDCDPDPACDIFDFLCFQNAFVSGCP